MIQNNFQKLEHKFPHTAQAVLLSHKMEYKKQYTPEEIREVAEWFKDHKEQMPQTLDVDKATHIPDFPTTVNSYIDIAQAHMDNATYSGQIYLLFKMRDIMKDVCGIQD